MMKILPILNMHFRYSTRAYYTSAEVIKDLRKYIPDYEKNTDVALLIADDIEIAMKNAEKLRNHFLDIGAEWPSDACNPRTDVPIIIDAINRYLKGIPAILERSGALFIREIGAVRRGRLYAGHNRTYCQYRGSRTPGQELRNMVFAFPTQTYMLISTLIPLMTPAR